MKPYHQKPSLLYLLFAAIALVAMGASAYRELYGQEAHGFENTYFEKVTGISLPDDYKVLENFDNGEWLTGAILQVKNAKLNDFVKKNNLQKIEHILDVDLMSKGYFKEKKPSFSLSKNIFFLRKHINDHNWVYVADLDKNELWVEISYPDYSGH
jgi:hypothetical protein